MTASPDSAPFAGANALAELVAARREAEAAERRVLRLVVDFAHAHPAPGLPESEGSGVMGGDRPVELAGAGAPGMSGFAVAEAAAALGLSTVSARRLIGQALELAHRLPRTWALLCDEPGLDSEGRAVRAGVVAWRARMVAERTVHLSSAQAAYVDAQVAPMIDKIGPGRLLRIVEAATVLVERSCDEDDAGARVAETDRIVLGASPRQEVEVRVDTGSGAHRGVAYVDARLDVADGLDLEKAIQAAAASVRSDADDGGETLAVRRARALGVIARHYLATAPGASGSAVGAGGVELVVHYRPGSEAAAAGLAALDNTRGLVTMEQVATWCRRQGARVRVQPIIDLAEDLTAGGYVPGPMLRTQVEQRDVTCVFPHCVTSAVRADLDHTVRYVHGPGAPPGQTRSDNLAALCRFHHRLKTHGEWSYQHLAPGWYHWRAPDGRHYLRGPTGSVDLTG